MWMLWESCGSWMRVLIGSGSNFCPFVIGILYAVFGFGFVLIFGAFILIFGLVWYSTDGITKVRR